MGWWSAGDGKVLGDGPVDRLVGAYGDLERSRAAAGQPRPAPQELFGLVSAAISREGTEIVDPAEWAAVAAEAPPAPASDDEISQVVATLRLACQEYEDSEMRRPWTAGELWETLRFAVHEVELRQQAR